MLFNPEAILLAAMHTIGLWYVDSVTSGYDQLPLEVGVLKMTFLRAEISEANLVVPVYEASS